MPVTLAVGGDVNFSQHRGELSHLIKRKSPHPLMQILNRIKAKSGLGAEIDYSPTRVIEEVSLPEYGGGWRNPLAETGDVSRMDLPFKHIGKFFKDSDLGFVNLETPLTDGGRHVGAFASSPAYAGILSENNIKVVSLANNHAFDAGERGFVDTLAALDGAQVMFVGGGHDIGNARRGGFVKVGGLTLGFLAYTSFCNSNFSSLAKSDQAGILPLFEPVVLDDIREAKRKCDFLTVAPHFDFENRTAIHRNSIHAARRMIDAGADLVVGSHAHLPKAIEVYRGKPIIYCLGNLAFPYASPGWGDSLVARVEVADSASIQAVRFYPLRCTGENSFSPFIPLDGTGTGLLERIRRSSRKRFGTDLTLRDHRLDLPFDRDPGAGSG